MLKKLNRYMFTFSMAILIVALSLIMFVLYNHFINDEILSQKTELNMLKKAYSLNGIAYFENLETNGNRITIIDKNGNVLFDNEVNKDTMENHINRIEIKGAIKYGISNSHRFSDTKYEYRLYSAMKLNDGKIIRISKPSINIIKIIVQLLRPIILIIIIIGVLTIVLSTKISYKFIKPINEINPEKPLEVETYEELSPLLVKIDKQNKKITKQIQNIETKNYEMKYISESISDGVVIISYDKRVLRVNNIANTLTGIKENEYFLNNCRIIEFKNAVEKALDGENSIEKITINNMIYMFRTSAVKLENSKYGVFVSIRNINEEENREKMRREFTANVSHELKTPLTSIMGTAELFSNDIIAPEDMNKFGTKIYHESQRLLCMIEDMIKLSMLDENYTRENFDYFDLDDTLSKVIVELNNIAKSKNIDINTNIENNQVFNMYGVKNLIHDMIFNLLDNAIKYTDSGGIIQISLKNIGNKIILSIKDNGIGIETNELESIFERFYRVDKSHSKSTGGSGLGLSIVKHISVLHNINVEAKSDGLGKGSEFLVTI